MRLPAKLIRYSGFLGLLVSLMGCSSSIPSDAPSQSTQAPSPSATAVVIEEPSTEELTVEEFSAVDAISTEIPLLISENPHANSVNLYNFLKDNYGKRIISGQQAQWDDYKEIAQIQEITGKTPAIRGFDFMDYSPSRTERGAYAEDTTEAIKWWKSGGIVTFCWHWNAPKDLIDQGPDAYWHSGFYSKATTFDLEKAMADISSEDYRILLRDIDAIAEQLKLLEEEGVPVLWRPLHEAAGGWFWWGAYGPKPYTDLWKTMYDRLTKFHHLTNLIWVWNGQDEYWYPGDEYVDIMGWDIYATAHDYSSQIEKFNELKAVTTENKIIALTENGIIPDPDKLIEDKAGWAWFCTWRGDFVIDENGIYSEAKTEKDLLIKMYTSEYTITKEDLPASLFTND